jgi:hypothetical protein
VESIEVVGKDRIATFRVTKTYKGSATGTLRFRASPTWTCDSSWAIAGEHALLFLQTGKPSTEQQESVFYLVSNGSGRLVVRTVDGERLLEPLLLALPIDIRVSKKLTADGGFYGDLLASFTDVESYILHDRIDSVRSLRAVRYWVNGTEACSDAGRPDWLREEFQCFDPSDPKWTPGVVRCNDAGIPMAKQRRSYECGSWHDASTLSCQFRDGDHSQAFCKAGVGDGGMPAGTASADLFCDRMTDGSLRCLNAIGWGL